MRADEKGDIGRLRLLWLLLGGALLGAVSVTVVASTSFTSDVPLPAMPSLAFALGLAVASLAMLLVVPLVRRTVDVMPVPSQPPILVGVLLLGLVVRLLLLASEPILEVDFNRYLWDGALTAHGFNPYALAPARVQDLAYNDIRLELAKAAGPVFEGISYPGYKTIYPPVAQIAFALAYLVEPWSLTAWRLVCVAADAMTVALLVALLRQVGRSPLWVVVYWWHPLVLKELVNSAHMEAILLPPLLGSLLLAARGRHVAAVAALGLAIGAKLWPVMLLPLLLRPLWGRPRQLIAALVVLGLAAAAIVTPIWLGGLDPSSGFVGFANYWATNSALFPALERLVALLVGDGGPERILPGRVVRLASAALIFALAVGCARSLPRHAGDLLARAFAVVSALVLLSPAQFPWYLLWVLPLAVLHRGLGWYVAAGMLPLYYTAFHFRAAGSFWIYETYVVWLIWLPAWGALAWEAWRGGWPPRQPHAIARRTVE